MGGSGLRRLLLLAVLLVVGCGDASEEERGAVGQDAGGESDAGEADVDDPDAEVPDDTPDADGPDDTPDAEVPDAEEPDVEVPPSYTRVVEEGGCNGPVALCERPFDGVSYATTHNAFATEEDGFLGPNQHRSMTRQLGDGVRALMLDVHDDDGVASLCHGVCLTGSRPLAEGLAEIAAFLDANPREVVTIIFETYVGPEAIEAAFNDSGAMAHVYHHSGEGWPTLQALIDRGERLVVFTDSGGGTFDWYLQVWDFAWETHFSASTPEDFSCAPNRGNTAHSLFIFNHFLTRTTGRADLAEQVNHNPFLIERARTCQEASGALPNFVTIDFHDIGDVIQTVDLLNDL